MAIPTMARRSSSGAASSARGFPLRNGLKPENGKRAVVKPLTRVLKSCWYSSPSSSYCAVRRIIVYFCPSPLPLRMMPEYSPRSSADSSVSSAVTSSTTSPTPADGSATGWPGDSRLGAGASAKRHETIAEPRYVSKTEPTKTPLRCASDRFQ
eukprot:scaffold1044_cov120-Isochrysis_galbana.AAC.20